MIPIAPGTARPIDVLLCTPWRDDNGAMRPSGKGEPITHPDFADLCADLLAALEECRVSLDGHETAADRAERTLRANAQIKHAPEPTPDAVQRTRRTAAIDATKGGLPLLVPAVCRDNRKRKANVERVTVFICDVDHATDAQWNAALERIDAAGLAWLAYGSPKDGLTPGEVRRRLVLSTSRDMSVAESERMQRAVPALLGLEADSATYDASRGFYVGAIEGADVYVAGTDEGAALDVDAVLREFKEPEPSNQTSRSKYAGVRLDARAAQCPPGVAPETHAVTLCREHIPAVEGEHGGTELLRLARDLVHGLALAPAIAAAVAWTHYNPRCEPPWRDAQRQEFDRKFTEARLPDGREAGWLLAGAPPIAESAIDAPAFVTTRSGKERWHLDPRHGAYAFVPFGERALHASLRETGADAYVQTHEGAKRKSPQALLDEGPTAIAENVAVDFACAHTTWMPATRTVREGVHARALAPRFDADVDAWLHALAADQYERVALFVASCARAFIARPAVALAVLGPDSIGKTLLARALAAMWGATHPVSLSVVLAQFNASMARCPIVLDDECAALKHEDLSTEAFRDLVQSDARDIEPKGLERRTLLGCQRFVLTGNDATDVRFADAGVGALDALGVRLVIVAVPRERRVAIIAALDKCHVPDSSRVDLERVCGHLAWMQAEFASRIGPDRFIGQGDTDDVAAALMLWRVAEFDALFERVASVLCGDVSGYADVFVHDGRLLVRTDELASKVGLESGRAVRRALGRACLGRVVVKLGAKAVTCAEIDALLVTRTMRLDVERVIAALDEGVPPALASSTFKR